ncbi:MAG: FliG C-terminal domain-containing protein [Rhodospirillaceae bacterium]
MIGGDGGAGENPASTDLERVAQFCHSFRSDLHGDRIKSLIFTVESPGKSDPAGVQGPLRGVRKKQADHPPLEGAPETLCDLFLTNMSKRSGEVPRKQGASLGHVGLKDIGVPR